jgi:hypothetical protein
VVARVVGPAGGVGVELAVAEGGVGARGQEQVDDRAVAAERGFVQGGGAVGHGVDVGAALEQQRDHGGAAVLGGADDQAGRRRCGDDGVRGHVRRLDAFGGAELRLGRAARAQHFGDVGVAVRNRHRERGATLQDRVLRSAAVGVDPGRQQERDATREATQRGPRQTVLGGLARARQRAPEPRPPGAAVAGSEAELEQQFEPRVVLAPVEVVDRLAVVGVRAGLEQQAGEGERVAVRRWVTLSAPERAGERRERRDQALPEEPRVRVGARVDEHPRHRERIAAGDARVREVEQRLPAVRPAERVGVVAGAVPRR